MDRSIAAGSKSQITWGLLVSGNYFSVLQVGPAMGRFFRPDEDQTPGKDPVMVISYSLWQRSFGGDPDVIGTSVKLNGYPFTIVGVTPRDFFGAELSYRSDFYVPVMMSGQLFTGQGPLSGKAMLETRLHRTFSIRGRLQHGMSLAQAQSEASLIMHGLAEAYPDTNKDIRAIVRKELDRRMASNGVALPAILFGLVVFLLLIACANVANLLMVRATSRLSEMATRLAIGATRGRLIRQLLTENSILACAGGALGLGLGYVAIRSADGLLPISFAPQGFRMDFRVLGYCLLISIATVFICGLAPALITTKEAAQSALKIRTVSEGNRFFGVFLRQLLVGGQITISIMLLIGGGLLVKSFARAQNFDLGFDPNPVLVASVDPGARGYSTERTSTFYKELLRKTETLPGVRSVALTANIHFLSGESWDISIDGYIAPNGEKTADVLTNRVGPRYFETMQMPLLEGRVFAETDNQDMPKVAVVNEKFARKFIVGNGALAPALGHTLRLRDGTQVQIIGIVKNSTYGVFAPIGSDPAPIFYLAYLQNPQSRMGLYVRTSGSPANLSSAVLQQIRSLDPEMVPYMTTLSAIVTGRGLFIPRISAILSGIFGLIALILTVVGLYGVVSFSVQRRTQEIGIRMALGAQRSHVLRMILTNSFILVGIGLILGLVGALIIAPFMRSLLVGVSSLDPVIFIVLPLIMLICAMVASWIPARRATSVEPVGALRYQ
jgi:predicted permease